MRSPQLNLRDFMISCLMGLLLGACSATSEETTQLSQPHEKNETANLTEELGTIELIPPTQLEKERGRKRAIADIAKGEPGVVFFGLPDFLAGEVDSETGLPWSTLGCCVDDLMVAYMDGYNGEVKRALKNGELKGMTYKDQLMTKKEALRCLSPKFEVLAQGGDGLRSPDGKHRLGLLAAENSTNQAQLGTLFIEEIESGKRVEMQRMSGQVDVVFVHKGATAVVGDSFSVNTYDIATFRFMQGFRRSR